MDGDKIPSLTAKELERLLSKYDFAPVSPKGSHQKWRNPVSGKRASVPFHGNQPLLLGTLRKS